MKKENHCSSLPVTQGLQTGGVLDSSGSPECDCDILTPDERKTSINRAKRQNNDMRGDLK